MEKTGLTCWLTISSRSRLVRFRWIGAAAAFMLVFMALLVMGGTGSALYAQPRGDALFDFFKEAFLVFCVVCASWFIVALRTTSQRWEEYRFLFSLPLHGETLYRHLFLTEWAASLWVPAWLGLVYAGMYAIAPWSFLCRLTIVTLLFHAASIIAAHGGHLALMYRARSCSNFIFKPEAWIALLSILLFITADLTCVVSPAFISGANFWLVALISLLVICAGVMLNGRLFERWRLSRAIHRTPLTRSRRYGVTTSSSREISRLINPWVWKSLLRSRRQANKGLFVLTAAFIALAYLASMNNPVLSDRAAVLLALTLLYSAIFVYLSMQHSAGTEEPPQQMYALPVKTLPWFGSMVIPAVVWLTGIYLIIGSLIAAYSIPLAAAFLIKSLLIGASLILCGMQSALGYYPDLKKAHKVYLNFLFAALVLSALFYRFHPLIIAMIALLPALRMPAIKYYRA